MRLHTRGAKADWEAVRPGRRTAWQRLAAVSGGVLTVGNFITLLGLVLVAVGALLLLHRHYIAGLVVLFFGRLADLLDGLLAEATQTKSPLGETIDATADKLALLLVLPAVAIEHLAPLVVLGVLLLLNLVNTAVALVCKARQIALHPTRQGKIAAGTLWLSIGVFVLASIISHNSLTAWHMPLVVLGWTLTLVSAVLGYRATAYYVRFLVGNKMSSATIKPVITGVVLVMNPQSSNIQRIEKRATELAKLFPDQAIDIVETSQNPSTLSHRLQKVLAGRTESTLVAIGGGDGTVNLVLNALLGLQPEVDLGTISLLPLWGGNANDFACMLNGLPSRARLRSILERGQVIAIYPFKVTITSASRQKTVRYAACYASFGAIAYAADQLAKPHKDRRLLSKSALGRFADEMLRALRAVLDASAFDAEQDGQRMKIFEQVFANGSRMAKVDRLPVKLNDRVFYKAAGSDKHPLFFMLRLLRGNRVGEITDKPAQFTTKERAWAQFDGEVVVLPKNTTITIAHAKMPFYALSTKLIPLENRSKHRTRKRRFVWILLGLLVLLATFHG